MSAQLQEARELGLLADRLSSAGLLAEALTQHQAATEAYRGCLVGISSPSLQTALRMMVTDHSKAARELERRISDDSKEHRRTTGRDRALPAIPVSGVPRSRRVALEPQQPLREGNAYRLSSNHVEVDESALFRPPVPTRPPSNVATPVQSHPSSPRDSRVNSESHPNDQTAEESYTFSHETDPQDSVTMFLNAVEGMLNQFDQPLNLPLAFATAPLSPIAGSPSARVQITPTKQKPVQNQSSGSKTSSGAEEEADTDSDSSFFMISSGSPASSTASLPHSPHKYPPQLSSTLTARGPSKQILREENAKLESRVTELSEQLARAEGVLRAQSEKEKAMRNGVLLLRRETQRMAASTTLGRPSLFTQMSPSLQASLLAPTIPVTPPQLANLQRHVRDLQQASGFTNNPTSESNHPSTSSPPPPPAPPILNPSIDPATLKRIKDLEAHVQSLKSENEQQRGQIAKYRERWQKLRENAKRRRGLPKDGALAPEKRKDDAEAGHSD